MDILQVKAAIPALLSWYDLHHRTLPWRIQPTPYRIWISEIMLQQTRIEAVIPHYHAFLERMPNLRALAEIPEEDLLKMVSRNHEVKRQLKLFSHPLCNGALKFVLSA